MIEAAKLSTEEIERLEACQRLSAIAECLRMPASNPHSVVSRSVKQPTRHEVADMIDAITYDLEPAECHGCQGCKRAA